MARLPTLQSAIPAYSRILRHFGPQIARQRGLIAGSMAALFVEIAARLIEPWPLKFVFDRVLATDGSTGTMDTTTLLLVAAGSVVAIAGLRAGASYVSTVGFALAGNRILTDVRAELFRHVQRLSLRFHHRAKTGDLLARVIGDISRVQEVTVTAAMPLFAHSVTLLAMLVVMLMMNWRLGLIALGTAPVFLLVTRRFGRRIHHASRRQRQREGEMGSTAAEAIAAVGVVQALAIEDVHNRAFQRQNSSSLKEGVATARLSARLERTVDLLIALGTAAVILIGARLAVAGDITPGDLIVFLAYMKSAFKPMKDLAKYAGRISKAAASGERVIEVLDVEPDITDAPDAVEPPESPSTLEFKAVRFTYDGKDDAVRDVTFRAHRGEMIAIVGDSGAGKSTVMNLICRLWDPTDGSLRADGVDLRTFRVRSWRSRVGVVPQNNVLFGVSVRENIAYGMPGATDADIEHAARLAQANEFIERLPSGYDTIIAERGETLSGGQRQRIAIARAIIRGAPILVLDEPTTGLDHANAALVHETIRSLRADRIIIVVTHDLNAVRDADSIVLLERGRVVETGSHEGLVKAGGSYARRWLRHAGESPWGAGHAVSSR
jgi:ATP-binding cassette subfamily B protein